MNDVDVAGVNADKDIPSDVGMEAAMHIIVRNAIMIVDGHAPLRSRVWYGVLYVVSASRHGRRSTTYRRRCIFMSPAKSLCLPPNLLDLLSPAKSHVVKMAGGERPILARARYSIERASTASTQIHRHRPPTTNTNTNTDHQPPTWPPAAPPTLLLVLLLPRPSSVHSTMRSTQTTSSILVLNSIPPPPTRAQLPSICA